jgi:FdhD protein
MIAEKRKLIKWTGTSNPDQSVNSVEEWVAREINLKININGKELVRFACSPVDCKDLAIGFLFTEGIISGLRDIDFLIYNETTTLVEITLNHKTKFDYKNWQTERTMSSGCGQGIISKLEYKRKNLLPIDFKINTRPECLSQLFYHLKTNSEWYEKTGCIHQVTLFNNDETIIIREDIGRHNAVDKVIGAALQCSLNFEETILNCSGRLSSDMILKAAKARIPVVVSRAAPTSLAIEIADELGITLIGFARGKRMNIYSHPERISFNEQLIEKEIPESIL